MKKYPRGLSVPVLYLTIILNIFFSETAWPIKAKFGVEPPWEVGKKVYINDTGYMTAMIIYGKNLQKSSLTELIIYDHETWHGAV